MASYIPGITDYIPHIQPFQPDLNFYQAGLERKEAQYNQGYNKISGIYGSLLNSPMLGSVDNETRDKFFKDIESSIQKVSTLDLSQEQNTDAAYQVFQPLIDDKNIMKNMAWTKKYQNQLTRAEGFRNCVDCGAKWWEGGVRALNYQAEDFAKAADNHNASSMEDPRYTPYISIQEKAIKNAKDMGFDIKSISWSPDGRYIVTQKNGAAMYTPLSEYFLGVFGSDPVAREVSDIQAYLTRKDFMKSNVGVYGSEDAAENFYLNNALSTAERSANINTKRVSDSKSDISAKREIIANKINNSGGLDQDDPLITQYLSFNAQSDVLNTAEEFHKETLNYLDKNVLIGADKKALRWRIDKAVSNSLLTNDLLHAAKNYADLTSETKIEADPYAKSSYDHALRLQEMHESHLNAIELQKLNWSQRLTYEAAKKELGKTRTGALNNNIWQPAPDKFQGASATADIIDTETELQDKFMEQYGKVNSAQDIYLKKIANNLQSLVDNDPNSAEGKSAANDLYKIFGSDYDRNTNKFRTEDIADGKNYAANRGKIYTYAKDYVNLPVTQQLYTGLYGELKPIEDKVKLDTDLWLTYDKIKKGNLQRLRTYAQSSADVPENKREMFQTLITDKGEVLSREQFATNWANKHATPKSVTEGLSREQFATNWANKTVLSREPFATNWANKHATPKSVTEGLSREQFATNWANKTVLYATSDPKEYTNVYKAAVSDYDDLLDLHAKLYRGNPSVGGKPVIQTWDPSVQLGGIANTFTGGKGTNAVTSHIDGASEDEGMMDGIRLFQGYKKKGALAVSYGYGSSELPENDPEAVEVLDRFMADITNGNYKDSDLKRPIGDLTFSGIALGDPSKVAFHIAPEGNWAEQTKYKGTPKTPGITGDKKYREGITVYMDRDKVPPEFMNKFQRGPYDIVINTKPITINDYPDAGSITITKTPQGTITQSGYMQAWDGEKYIKVNAPNFGINSFTSADIYVQQIKYIQKLQHQANEEARSLNTTSKPITNINQLQQQR